MSVCSLALIMSAGASPAPGTPAVTGLAPAREVVADREVWFDPDGAEGPRRPQYFKAGPDIQLGLTIAARPVRWTLHSLPADGLVIALSLLNRSGRDVTVFLPTLYQYEERGVPAADVVTRHTLLPWRLYGVASHGGPPAVLDAHETPYPPPGGGAAIGRSVATSGRFWRRVPPGESAGVEFFIHREFLRRELRRAGALSEERAFQIQCAVGEMLLWKQEPSETRGERLRAMSEDAIGHSNTLSFHLDSNDRVVMSLELRRQAPE